MVVSALGSNLVLDAGTIKFVKEARYMGFVLTSVGVDDKDISRKLNQSQTLKRKPHPLL